MRAMIVWLDRFKAAFVGVHAVIQQTFVEMWACGGGWVWELWFGAGVTSLVEKQVKLV
jgi:hypothetical protein